MSKYLDLDDVAAGNPVAEHELAQLRLEAALATTPPEGETQGEAAGGREHDGLPTVDDLKGILPPNTPPRGDAP